MALLYVLEMSTAKVLEIEALQEDCRRFNEHIGGGVFVNRNVVSQGDVLPGALTRLNHTLLYRNLINRTLLNQETAKPY